MNVYNNTFSMANHEITNTITDRESPEISLKDSNNAPDYELALNKEKQNALVLEVQELKQNKKPQDMPDIHKEKENI